MRTMKGVMAIPNNVSRESKTSKIENVILAISQASSSFLTRYWLKTGIKEADNAPSPNRLRNKFGILNAT